MSQRNKVTKAVDRAFEKIGDLALDATFSNKSVSAFNFTSGEVVQTTQTITKRVVVQSSMSESNGVPTITTYLLTKSTGEDFSVYTEVTIGAAVYNIVKVVDDSFIVTAVIVRSK